MLLEQVAFGASRSTLKQARLTIPEELVKDGCSGGQTTLSWWEAGQEDPYSPTVASPETPNSIQGDGRSCLAQLRAAFRVLEYLRTLLYRLRRCCPHETSWFLTLLHGSKALC
jgi:hypothetical protein